MPRPPLPLRGAGPASHTFPALPGVSSRWAGPRAAVLGQGVPLSRLCFSAEPSVLGETCLALQGSGSQSLSGAGTAWHAHGIAQGAGLWPVLQWKCLWVGAPLPAGLLLHLYIAIEMNIYVREILT